MTSQKKSQAKCPDDGTALVVAVGYPHGTMYCEKCDQLFLPKDYKEQVKKRTKSRSHGR